MMIPQLFIFDIHEKVQAVLGEKEYFEAFHNEKITGENSFTFKVPSHVEFEKAAYIKESNYVGFFDLDNVFQMFEIKFTEEKHSDGMVDKYCECEHVYYELLDHIIEDIRPQQKTAGYALDQALNGTRWTAGNVLIYGVQSTNFYYENVISAMDKIRDTWLFELDGRPTKGFFKFRIVFDADAMEITNRFVDFLPVTGSFTGKRFEYGKDIVEIKRTIDTENLFTAAYGRGKGVEVGDVVQDEGTPQASTKATYGRRLNFADLEWIAPLTPVVNPNFNTGDLTGWEIVEEPDNVEVTDEESHTGRYSLKVTSKGFYFPGVKQTVQVEPETKYTCSCLALPKASENAGVEFEVDYYDSGDNLIEFDRKNFGGYYAYLFGGAMLILDKWQLLTLDIETPPNTAYVEISITDVELSGGYFYIDRVQFGNPVNKPLGQEWLEDVTATTKWGRGTNPASKIKRMGIYTNDEETDPSRLLEQTWDFIQAHKEPLISYEMIAGDLERLAGREHEKVRLGDIAYVLDREFADPIQLTTRIIEITRNLLQAEETGIVFGNFAKDIIDTLARQADLERKMSDRQGVWDRGTVFDLDNSISFPISGERIVDPLQPPITTNEALLKVQVTNEDGTKDTIGGFYDTHFEYKAGVFGQIWAENILNVYREPLAFFVNNDTVNDNNSGLSSLSPVKSFAAVMAKLPKILLANVTVEFQETGIDYQENLEIEGLAGSGLLELKLNSVSIAGRIRIRNCTCPMWVRGVGGTLTSASSYAKINTVVNLQVPCQIYNSMKVRFTHIWANANSMAQFGFLADSSGVVINNCVAEKAVTGKRLDTSMADVSAAVGGKDNARVVAYNNRGYTSGQQHAMAAFYGASVREISVAGTTQFGVDAAVIYQDTASTATSTTVARTATPAGGATPAGQTLVTVDATASRSWRTNTFNWRSDNDRVYQGEWSNYGNHIGMIFFGTGFNALSGETIKSAKLKIKRLNGGGANTRNSLRFWGHSHESQPTGTNAPNLDTDYGVLASAAWNEEITVDLPSSFISEVVAGTVKGLGIYEPGRSPYVIMEGVTEYDIRIEFLKE